MNSNLRLYIYLIIFRSINVALIKTIHHPDEAWQSLEVGHRLAYGYGYLTWEWREKIRGWAYPLLFASLYRISAFFGLDNQLLFLGPWILVILISASIDYYTFKFAVKFGDNRIGEWTLLCSIISWMSFSGIPRPLSNSIETMFAALAYSYWPWAKNSNELSLREFSHNLKLSLIFAGIGCIFRPTNGVIWAIAGVGLLLRINTRLKLHTLISACVVGTILITVMFVVDRIGYGEWCFPVYNFYKFNLQENLAVWFGESSGLFHIFVSVPVLFTTLLPLIALGIYCELLPSFSLQKSNRIGSSLISRACSIASAVEPALVALGTIIVYSFAGHKEPRFLFPLLPIGFVYSGIGLNTLYGSSGFFKLLGLLNIDESSNYSDFKLKNNNLLSSVKYDSHPNPRSRNQKYSSNNKLLAFLSQLTFPSKKLLLTFLVITNIPIALYSNLFHKAGSVSVMKFLRREAQNGNVSDIGFLMPCHNTPFYSHIHTSVYMWFLTCDPPLKKSELESHYWEAQDFETDPIMFLNKNMFEKPPPSELEKLAMVRDPYSNVLHYPVITPFDTPPHTSVNGSFKYWPSHLVMFGAMEARISGYLIKRDYKKCASFFNTIWDSDQRIKGDVVVYCKV